MHCSKILITGASGGIGSSVARLLGKKGRSLVIHGRQEVLLGGLATELDQTGAQVFPIHGDLTAAGAPEKLVASAIEKMSGLDAVVHCAGIGHIGSTESTSDKEVIDVLNLNTRATYLLAQAACKAMGASKKGRFIAIPGILGKRPMRGAALYCASKFATAGMLQSMALEYQRQGIQFSLFYFGGVDTPFWDSIAMKVDRSKMLAPEDAAKLIAAAIEQPAHLVMNEVTLQPESHQL
ncbi:MAG: short-subunit dehydrogenase [Verrucomicrobiales bacterium]|jgi:short-subunit dehydrogenase